VCAKRPAVVSFTFGCPATQVVDRLHAGDIAVWVTVTNVDEARAAHAAGADGLVVAPEAATADAQRALLAESRPTRVTRAFSGRPARGIVNRFLAEHTDVAPLAYPEIHHVTSPMRAAARKRGDADAFNLWAGQAHELVQARPAGEIVRAMAAEAATVIEQAGRVLGRRGTSGGRR
jgi:nitronate monooxygenase